MKKPKPYYIYFHTDTMKDGEWSMFRGYDKAEAINTAYDHVVEQERKSKGKVKFKYVILPYFGKHIIFKEEIHFQLLESAKP